MVHSELLQIGRLPPPNKLYLSTANFVSRRLTFTWSPVAPDCPAIHYNILASNCGSCPTTTNHTTVTCTDVPINQSTCTFAVQTVLCGNLIGNLSDPINTTILPERRNTDTCTNTAYVVATRFLAVALVTSVVVFVTIIVIILKRSKEKIKAALDLQQTSRAERSTHMETMYEDVTGPVPSVGAINTQDNVAYGHTKTPIIDNTCM